MSFENEHIEVDELDEVFKNDFAVEVDNTCDVPRPGSSKSDDFKLSSITAEADERFQKLDRTLKALDYLLYIVVFNKLLNVQIYNERYSRKRKIQAVHDEINLSCRYNPKRVEIDWTLYNQDEDSARTKDVVINFQLFEIF